MSWWRPGAAQEESLVDLREGEGVSEKPHRMQVRNAARAALQIADAPHAQPGAFGKLLLRESRLCAQLSQEFAERGWFTAHYPGPITPLSNTGASADNTRTSKRTVIVP